MIPKFTICRLGAQKKVPNVDTIIKDSDLKKICTRLTRQPNYTVEWVNTRIKGKMFTLETDEKKYYITYTLNEVGGRNSYLQSVPTAFGLYLNDARDNYNRSEFCLYFTPVNGNNKTRYHIFMYRLLASIGVLFLNDDEGVPGLNIRPYDNVRDLIENRESNSERNRGNRSSYITDEGGFYHVYGKTFGANQKETTMLCFALCAISDKPIRLFQIADNDSEYLSQEDIESIRIYQENYGREQIDILNDTYEFEDESQTLTHVSAEESLRSPRFIFNLLEKTGGQKCCSLCHCKIESIIQGAHIYPVKAIKQRTDLTFEERLTMATDGNNGIWLCENHHKLFDRGLIRFMNRQLVITPSLNNDDANFVESISPYHEIEQNYYTPAMADYFNKRDNFYNEEGIY